jgi:hypothetical protein
MSLRLPEDNGFLGFVQIMEEARLAHKEGPGRIACAIFIEEPHLINVHQYAAAEPQLARACVLEMLENAARSLNLKLVPIAE